LIKSEERLFLPSSACADTRAQALGLGEAEGNEIIFYFSNSSLLVVTRII
jgi:hypothetical protein